MPLNEKIANKRFFLQFAARIIKLIVSLCLFLLDRIVFTIKKKISYQQPIRLIIYYHSIDSKERPQFRQQMKILKKFSTLVPIDMLNTLNINTSVPLISVTFDDGFDNYAYFALPEMAISNIPSTVFIPTNYIGKKPFWKENYADEQIMSAETIKRINKNPLVTIGSHSLSHRRLNLLSNHEIKNEILNSKTYLETLLNEPVNYFSCPHGAYNKDVLKIAYNSGFTRIFGISPMLVSKQFDNDIIGRVMVSPSDWRLEFFLKIHGSYRWMVYTSQYKKVLLNKIHKWT